jgi:shikimate kinase
LTGFSGTGKSTVAALLAQRSGWRVIDMDQEIERQAGMPIPAIFRQYGEADFRKRERDALRDAVAQDAVVVATGGGASASEAAWTGDLLRSPGTLVVTLDADPEAIVARLVAQQAAQGDTAERPMLAGEDPVARIRALKAERQVFYDRADLTLIVDGVTPEQVADEIAQVLALQSGTPLQIRLKADSADSLIRIRSGALDEAGTYEALGV